MKPSVGGSRRRELRTFGMTMAAALAVLGLLALWRGKSFYPGPLGLALLFALAGAACPLALAPIQRGWMALGAVLGWFMTRLVLAALFYLAFTPIGLVGRLMGRRFLDSAIDRSRETYWIRRVGPGRPGEANEETAHYDRQF